MGERSHDQLEHMLKEKVSLLSALTRSGAVARGDVLEAIREMTEIAADVLEVNRVGFWRLRDGGGAIELMDLYIRPTDKHEAGIVLTAEAAPRYFDAVRTERSIAADDALQDPRTSEFTESYLKPLGIGALLDAPVMSGGELVGVVCHEHTGGPRQWTAWDELAAGTFADCVALAIDNAEAIAQRAALQKAKDDLEKLVMMRTDALKKSQDSFRQLFQAAPVALVLTNPADNTVVETNARASELFGIPQQTARGLRTPDFWLSQDDRNAVMVTLVRDGKVDGVEAQLRAGNGRVFWADISAQRIEHEGLPALLVGFRDITPMKEAQAQLQVMATTDALTGACNRRRFFELAEREVERADRYAHPLALAMIDLDHFKAVNDRFGHQGGDDALAHVARVIQASLRGTDTLGRYGGEELAVLLPETTAAAALEVIERVAAAVRSSAARSDGTPIPITVSAGVATRKPGELLPSLVARADGALYAAKRDGRDRVVAAG